MLRCDRLGEGFPAAPWRARNEGVRSCPMLVYAGRGDGAHRAQLGDEEGSTADATRPRMLGVCMGMCLRQQGSAGGWPQAGIGGRGCEIETSRKR